ncbi:hypothetical protein [Enterococcus malodoratus]|uniref:Uncharacterized protein n=1 Tax=Enterococcus malodoratus ATCC 43197 TaxID=1158601 RepID=R2REE7_9ENTE|nr:hypothetical protein [Enterococcus malodoratus]EOH78961.1 hypothetical protein UAI_01606 [Enterococcus malodoratus ATCC 43197]EOT64614.1 hypothetical protein I585_03815 [Enterococcus malodoratus ATCC 43197]OJG65586.1 hypothetical protein RV07_GL002456 [Enterococcus malodoratus]SPX03772.1 Uncharacterised protein [Enterococcus malodoratus]STC72573.1 Uncharacterised protein [Enterococcus malodoratus]
MEEYGLSRNQLFTLTRKTLEKRVNNYYQTTNDGNGAIEILIALQVREELCEADFSMMLMELVQHIFLRTRSTAAMRRYYLYFAEYFEKKEWRLLSIKLFPAKTYIAEKLRTLYTQFIKEPLAGLVGS